MGLSNPSRCANGDQCLIRHPSRRSVIASARPPTVIGPSAYIVEREEDQFPLLVLSTVLTGALSLM